MSRAYRISVSESLSRVVEVEDGVCTALELLEVLPRERMGQLLGSELAKLGFEVSEDGATATRQDEDGITVSVVLGTGEVTVRIAGSQEVNLEIQRSETTAREQQDKREEKLRDSVKAELETELEARKEQLRRQVTEKLEKKLRDLRQELDRAATRTTAEALKERAAQLGEIQEISEDASGSMTIRVKI